MAEAPIDKPDPSPPGIAPTRRKGITPEERRLLGTPRTVAPESPVASIDEPDEEPTPPSFEETLPAPIPDRSAAPESGRERTRGVTVVEETKGSRRIETQRAILVIGLLIFIFAIFWAGRKFDRVRYMITSRMNATKLEGGPEQFPGLTAEELVEEALAAEKRADWTGAAQRFVEAKRKDRLYQGILFRIGKSAYDRGDWAGADQALEQALKFRENVAVANHLRGLIAVRRHDLPAAERFFEAATKAEPFVADFFYFWGETLRLNQRPRDAMVRYRQALVRTPSTSDATLCQFKIRLARLEATDAPALATEVEEMRKAGPLSVDWLITEAALQLHAGNIKEAVDAISQARSAGSTGLFLTCVGDTIFLKASESHPEIAALVKQTTAP